MSMCCNKSSAVLWPVSFARQQMDCTDMYTSGTFLLEVSALALPSHASLKMRLHDLSELNQTPLGSHPFPV